MDTAAIAALRSKHMGGNLSLHYAPEPLHIVRGEGAHLFDSEGRKYIDLSNNVAHVGHSHPAVVAAAHAQLSTLNTNTRYHNEVYVRYAAELAALFPDPLSVVFLVNSGSEANDLALRLARAHTGGSDVICLDHAYHGHTQACIDVSPYKFNGKGGRGRPPHTHVTICPDPYRGVFRPEPAAGDAAADESENTAVGAAFAADVARICNGLAPAPGPSASPAGAVPPPASLCAFIAESYLGCGGQIALAPGYLQAAYAAVRAKSGVCIADEVQVGFGRVGTHMWGFELQGVVPDIVTLGKPIGNGYPLAAVVTTPAIAASFANGMEYFNTFGGATASAAVGRAVLSVLADEHLQQAAAERGAAFMVALRARVQARHAAVGDVRGHGFFVGIEIVSPAPWAEKYVAVARDGTQRAVELGAEQQRGLWRAPATAAAAWLTQAVRRRGFLISTDGPYSSVLKIKPPMVVSAAELDAFVAALDEALEEMARTQGPEVNVVANTVVGDAGAGAGSLHEEGKHVAPGVAEVV